ncbi:MAG: biotin transporter BioY [Phycisphaerales bacterium]|nr:MAG: biotin transporter BioY [Phycisphaerales bacterium]
MAARLPESNAVTWPSRLAAAVLGVGASSAQRRVAVQVGGFALLAALLAQVRIHVPVSPVPITLQTLAVVLTGLCLPPGRAAAAMAAYVCAGLVVLAVWPAGSLFAAASFSGLLLSGGYLVGFLLAAPAVAVVAGTPRASAARLALAGAAGMGVVFAFGCAWLVTVAGFSLEEGIRVGLWPFVPQEVVKVALAVSVVVCARRVGRAGGS